MLPVWKENRLTFQMLSDRVVDAALERCEYDGLTTDTARKACYQWMSHSAVWDEELEQFEKEFRNGKYPEDKSMDVLCAVADISNEIESILLDNAICEYRDTQIHDEMVTVAMEKAHVVADITDMSSLLSTLAVAGKREIEEHCAPILEESNITIDDVIRVAKKYGEV